MNYKILLSSAALLAVVSSASAQELQTGFFLDNYAYSHRINPALQASRDDVSGYFGAGADNFVISAHTNVGVNNFLFPSQDGKLVIGLDDYVSDEEFLSGLSPVNTVRLGINENLFAIGGKGKRGLAFNFELNLKSNNNVNVSKDVFELLKKGGDLGSMQFDDFSIGSRNYLEAALGFGKKCGRLSLGFKVKALVGVASADLSINELSVDALGDDFSIQGNADVRIAAKPVDYLDDQGRFKTPGLGKIGSSGMGVAFDLGAVFEATDRIEISASVNDLGGITWDCETNGYLAFKNSEELEISVSDNTPEKQLQLLPVDINAGLRYRINKTFCAGALLSAKTGKQSIFEARGGVTCTPGSVLSLAVSAGVNSFGTVFGGALNLCLGPVNLFAGIDQIVTSFTPQWIPVGKVNTNASLGLLVSW